MVTTAATSPNTDNGIDLDALRADAEQRLDELGEARQRLALDAAIGDVDAQQELANIEAEIRAAGAEVERASLAAQERERREAEATEKAESERIAAARTEAEKLGRQLAAEAEKVDGAARAYAAAVAAYGSTYERRQEARQAAGDIPWGRGGRPLGVGAGLRFHLLGAGALAFVDVRDGCPDRPLAAEVNR